MRRADRVRSRLRRICLSLPGARETLTWGKPHFRVDDRIFGGEASGPVIGFKLSREHAAPVVRRPGLSGAPDVGRHGRVSMDASGPVDWSRVSP